MICENCHDWFLKLGVKFKVEGVDEVKSRSSTQCFDVFKGRLFINSLPVFTMVDNNIFESPYKRLEKRVAIKDH
jgi:hypothetical protein